MRAASGALALAALLAAAAARAAAPLRVVATIEPLCMLAREVGGERVSCTALVPPGASPHAFEPRPSALAAVADAKLLLRAGNEVDDWAERLAYAGERTWTVIGPPCAANDSDCAHFWLSAAPAARASRWIRRALAALDPDGAAFYAEREARFGVSLLIVDVRLRALLEPVRGTSFVAFHPAWGGFAKSYGLRQVGTIQDHGAEEPTPRRLADLLEAARAARVRAVLVEPQLDPHTARILAEQLGAQVVTVDPLGDPRDPERATPEALLTWNARRLAAALAGPPR